MSSDDTIDWGKRTWLFVVLSIIALISLMMTPNISYAEEYEATVVDKWVSSHGTGLSYHVDLDDGSELHVDVEEYENTQIGAKVHREENHWNHPELAMLIISALSLIIFLPIAIVSYSEYRLKKNRKMEEIE